MFFYPNGIEITHFFHEKIFVIIVCPKSIGGVMKMRKIVVS
jgi:hypothetical protein